MRLSLKVKADGKIGGYFADQLTVREKTNLQSVGGRYNKQVHKWFLPLDTDIDNLYIIADSVQFDDSVKKYLQQKSNQRIRLAKIVSGEIPTLKYGNVLDDYQKVGVGFLINAKHAILADDAGLGKTLQTIAAFLEINAQKVLVVTKKSLIYNWVYEMKKWFNLDAAIFTTASKAIPDARVVVTNYESVMIKLDWFKDATWDVLVCDEAAYIKNRKAARSKAIATIAKDVPYVWLLTATPMPNNTSEIWHLLHVLYPEKFTSFWRFCEQYCYMEDGYFGGKTFLPGIKNKASFQRLVETIMLRRDKKLLKLPPISYEDVHLKLNKDEAKMYVDIAENLMTIINGNMLVTPSAVAQITRLRQITCSPKLLGADVPSSKVETLKDLLEEYTQNHKVLVFTNFAEYVKVLEKELKGYNPVKVIGEMSAKARQDAVDKFTNEETCKVLIGTIKAMGEGLNIQKADVVIFTDKDWNPSNNYIQAVGRAYRRGQENPVHVISLIAENTIDEHVEEVLKEKLTTQQALEKILEKIKEDFRKLKEG